MYQHHSTNPPPHFNCSLSSPDLSPIHNLFFCNYCCICVFCVFVCTHNLLSPFSVAWGVFRADPLGLDNLSGGVSLRKIGSFSLNGCWLLVSLYQIQVHSVPALLLILQGVPSPFWVKTQVLAMTGTGPLSSSIIFHSFLCCAHPWLVLIQLHVSLGPLNCHKHVLLPYPSQMLLLTLLFSMG